MLALAAVFSILTGVESVTLGAASIGTAAVATAGAGTGATGIDGTGAAVACVSTVLGGLACDVGSVTAPRVGMPDGPLEAADGAEEASSDDGSVSLVAGVDGAGAEASDTAGSDLMASVGEGADLVCSAATGADVAATAAAAGAAAEVSFSLVEAVSFGASAAGG